MKKLKPEEIPRNISDRIMQLILRVETLIKSSNFVLILNIVILSVNVFILVDNISNRKSTEDILKAQYSELKQHSELLKSISNEIQVCQDTYEYSPALRQLNNIQNQTQDPN